MNSVHITGRIYNNLQLKEVGDDKKKVCNFSIMTKEEYSEEIDCEIWGKSAENLYEFAAKGSLIEIEGKLKTKKREDKDGRTLKQTLIIISRFGLLEPKEVNLARKKGNENNEPGSYNKL